MGRKRLDKPKKAVNLSIDQELLADLDKVGVNKSRLFTIAANKYLRKKRKLNKKAQNLTKRY